MNPGQQPVDLNDQTSDHVASLLDRQRDLQLQLDKTRAEAAAARSEARAAELELQLRETARQIMIREGVADPAINDDETPAVNSTPAKNFTPSDATPNTRVAATSQSLGHTNPATAHREPSSGFRSWSDIRLALQSRHSDPAESEQPIPKNLPNADVKETQALERISAHEEYAASLADAESSDLEPAEKQPIGAMPTEDSNTGDSAKGKSVTDEFQNDQSASDADSEQAFPELHFTPFATNPEDEPYEPKSIVDSELAAELEIESSDDNPAAENRKRKPVAVVMSAILHAVILFLLAGFTLASAEPKDQVALTASATEPSETVMETFSFEEVKPEEVTEPAESEQQYEISDLGEMPIVDSVSAIAAEVPPPPTMASPLKSTPLKNMKSLSETASTEKMEFCGVEGGGNHFVYLVDSSGSMGEAFDFARNALLQSIDMLKKDQRFYVVFFDSKPDYMRLSNPDQDEPSSVMATPENKRKLRQWAMRVTPDRGRAPYEPLEFTMKLRPDVVFLLSDGEFPQGIEDYLQEENHYTNLFGDSGIRSIVHTIGYFSREGEARMRRIAEANRGQYRHVPKR